MGWLKRRKLGSRTLRLGDRGRDVQELHEFLQLQGYDLAEEDYYGYLTWDAVRQFQRDHGLIADGIAGQLFFALILMEELPIRRRVHTVQPQETLEQIAQLYGLSPEAFNASSTSRRAYPGQRLVFFEREIWAICSKSSLLLPTTPLTGIVSMSPLEQTAQIEKTFNELPCMLKSDLSSEDDVVQIHELLKTPKKRKTTTSALLTSLAGSCGLYVPWKRVAMLDGARYLKLLKQIRQKLPPEKMLWVEIGPGIPQWKVWGGLDYEKLNNLVDRVVLSLPVPAAPGPLLQRNEIEELVCTFGTRIHSWKILLRTPVYTLEWEITEESKKCLKLAYNTALSRAYRHGARLERDEQGGLFYRYKRRGSEFQLRLPPYNAMGDVLQVINRYNLAGIVLDQLGMEDPRIWNILTSHFRCVQL